ARASLPISGATRGLRQVEFRPTCLSLVAAAPAAAVAATAAAAVAATVPAAGAGPLLAGRGLVARQRAAADLRAVERGDRLVGGVVHLDEREAAAAAGLAVGDDLRAQHGAVLGERLHEVVAGGLERDVTDVQLLRHKPFHSGPAARKQSARKPP